jgi:ABC-type antimicrobial peptide transport system permease subunit
MSFWLSPRSLRSRAIRCPTVSALSPTCLSLSLQRRLGQALPSSWRKAGTISRRLGTPSVRRRLSQCARTVRGAMLELGRDLLGA